MITLVALGVALRALASISWWPVSPTLQDGYQLYTSNPFLDPLHPPGYGFILGLLGHISRQIAFTVVVQHIIGCVSVLLFVASVYRVTGSRWAALLPALFLIAPDEVFLEHSIMSESWAVLTIAVGLYATVRGCERPEKWGWAALAGAAFAASAIVRTAALPLIPIAAVTILLYRAGSLPGPGTAPVGAHPGVHRGGDSHRVLCRRLALGPRFRLRTIARLVPLRPRGAIC